MRTLLAETKSIIRIQSCMGFYTQHKTAKDKIIEAYKQISVNVIDT